MDLLKLFSPSYLLEIQPSSDFPLFWFFAVLFGLLILVGFGVWVYTKFIKAQNLLTRVVRFIPARFIGYGIGGFLFLFFRSQAAPYLAMRIWLFLYTLWVLYVVYASVRDVRRDYGNRKSMREERRKIKADDYLPQQKKRSSKKRRRS